MKITVKHENATPIHSLHYFSLIKVLIYLTFEINVFLLVLQAYIACTLGVSQIGPVMMCFGAVSSTSCILIGICASRHIKRFAFITAGATFNVGLLIVLWLWKPTADDVPNFFVVAGCLGLCDAIWQTQTYSMYLYHLPIAVQR